MSDDLKRFRVSLQHVPVILLAFSALSFIVLLTFRIYLVPRFSGIDDLGYLWTSLSKYNIANETHPLFKFRVGMSYTLYFFKEAFNFGSSSYWIVTVAAEVLAMAIITLAIFKRFGEIPAILLIALWSFYPLSYYQTTYYMPGVFQVLSISIALYLIITSYESKSSFSLYSSFLLAGLSLGVGYLYKEDTAIVVFVMILSGFIVKPRDYKIWIILGMGAGLVFVSECITYYVLYDDAFIRIKSTLGQAASVSGNYSKIWDVDAYLKSLYILPHKVGIYWWLLIPALVFSLGKSKTHHFLVTSVIISFLWLQFGTGSFSHYSPLPKVPRYTAILWPMVITLISLWVSKLYVEKKLIFTLVMISIAVTSTLSLLFFNIQAGERSRNAISAVNFLRKAHITEVYTDQYTKKLLSILADNKIKCEVLYHANFSEAKSGDVKLEVKILVDDISDKYVLLDYQQSKIFTGSYGIPLPTVIQHPPDEWELIWSSHAYVEGGIDRNVLKFILDISKFIPIDSIKERIQVFIKDMIVNDEVMIYKIPPNWSGW